MSVNGVDDCDNEWFVFDDRVVFEYNYRHMVQWGLSPYASDVDSFNYDNDIYVYNNEKFTESVAHEANHILCDLRFKYVEDSSSDEDLYALVDSWKNIEICNMIVDNIVWEKTGIDQHEKIEWMDPRCDMVLIKSLPNHPECGAAS